MLVSNICPSHFTCDVNHCTTYQNLPLFLGILFIIPVIVDIGGHRFEIYTLVSDIHGNVDLVLGIKNIFELEGVITQEIAGLSF